MDSTRQFEETVFELSKLPADIQLLRWNKELQSGSEQDPLGLTLRVAARLSAELLHCITSITPRARYYSFFPWAFQDYWNNERGKAGDRGEQIGILARERALALGSVLHHNGAACKGGALGGTEKAIIRAATLKPGDTIDLSTWQHLERGIFDAAYKASLVSLHLFEIPENDEQSKEEIGEDKMNAVTIRQLSPQGKILANAFASSIANTEYIKSGSNFKSVISYETLKDFGAHAGLCEILLDAATDRAALRDIMFDCDNPMGKAHYRRRMSLLLLLQSVESISAIPNELSFHENFADLVFYQRIPAGLDTEDTVSVSLPPALLDAAGRWSIFQYHSYLSIALQSFLVGIVRILRDREEGIDQRQILNYFDEQEISKKISDIFACPPIENFYSMSPEQTLKHIGIIDSSGKLSDAMTERHISRALVQNKGAQGEGGIGLALVLIYTLFHRYKDNVCQEHDNWHRQQVPEYSQTTDICLPLVLKHIQASFGQSW